MGGMKDRTISFHLLYHCDKIRANILW